MHYSKQVRVEHIQKSIFTMIELLTIISIIIILISLLFPALSKVKEKSKQTYCLNNLRQTQNGMLCYGIDYNGFFPLADSQLYGSWTSVYHTLWPSTIIEYMQWHVFICPSQLDDNYFQKITKSGNALRFVHYGYNYLHIGSSFRYGGNTLLPAKNSQIKNPSATFLLMDATYDPETRVGWYIVKDNPSAIDCYPDARHSSGMNIGWADGHCSYKTVKVKVNPFLDLGSGTSVGSENNQWDRY